ncbi:hypothetical protein SEA_TESLA_5 [Mycobacterium phage Tesla]|uniref:Uncharacterized protein n=1 Tax=Mycobacterium phage Tesla TaxID=2079425 RepID=A0A2L1IZV8_9CAUD|nr:hypothetical protein SEA_TESLA_5 [Mycobacterium phage Tesla]
MTDDANTGKPGWTASLLAVKGFLAPVYNQLPGIPREFWGDGQVEDAIQAVSDAAEDLLRAVQLAAARRDVAKAKEVIKRWEGLL